MERKLSAILAADVVGYTALMERDEKGTHERLVAGRKELFEPEVARHHGRVFKVMGDGLLAEFGSVVDAVECAVALQRGLSERNEAFPEDQRIQVRIGINLGEVIVEGDDRFGEGVNIATRLEQLAEPGGIYVSGKVAKEVEKKLAFRFEPMGEQKVKNISEPVSIFRIKLDDTPARRRSPISSRRIWPWAAVIAAILLMVAGAWFAWRQQASDEAVALQSSMDDTRPSLVVLPFDSLGEDKEQSYLADGMTEDITTALARIPNLFVISRNSASTYKGKAVQPAQIAKELGVRYILEGSIRRTGDNVRINAHFIDATTGGHLYAERFDGAWNDIFDLQDQVITQVASALKLRLVSGPRMAASPGGTDNTVAYDLYLRGYEFNYATSPAEAAALHRQAVALDPNFGQAWAELGWIYWFALGNDDAQNAIGASSYQEAVVKMREMLKEAEKHPSASYYQLMCDVLMWQRKPDEATLAAERAIALDPSEFGSYEMMSLALVYSGRASDAKAYLDAAGRVDPSPRPYRHFLAGLVAFAGAQFEDAIVSLEKADPKDFQYDVKDQRLFLLAAAHAHLGHTSETASAKAALETHGKESGRELTGLRAINILPFKRNSDMERLWVGLSKAGVPGIPSGYQSGDLLTGKEVRSLVFGHELRGRQIDTGESYVRSTAPDGSSKVTNGSVSTSGLAEIDGNFLCTAWESDIVESCVAILRNPEGSQEGQDEYLLVTWPGRRFGFSVVK